MSSELLPDRVEPNDLQRTPPGTLPASVDISAAARDLLRRLLQPEPRLRLRTLLSLQRIAFYMGHDLQSYMLKKAKKINFIFCSCIGLHRDHYIRIACIQEIVLLLQVEVYINVTVKTYHYFLYLPKNCLYRIYSSSIFQQYLQANLGGRHTQSHFLLKN